MSLIKLAPVWVPCITLTLYNFAKKVTVIVFGFSSFSRDYLIFFIVKGKHYERQGL